ncbi:MAG TPA: MarR family transcriptional regulator [Euryarchaeota archaeon]|mgnify:CR=1 FL=1|nr:MarR family transcriptional regulator [Euryarchaeota archaeon]
MFLNEKACKIIIALKYMGEANITEVARAANANIGHTSNTLVKAMLKGYVEQRRRRKEVIVKLTDKGRAIADILEEVMKKTREIEEENTV